MSTVAVWADETSTAIHVWETSYGNEATTALSEWSSAAAQSSRLLPFKIALIALGILGTATNGIVLVGFWMSDRSKMNSSSIQIANHTTLDLHLDLHFLDLLCQFVFPTMKRIQKDWQIAK